MNIIERKEKRKTTFKNAVYVILTFFCFFPFLFPVPGLSMDMQPYAIIFASFVLLLNIRKVFKTRLPNELTVFFFLLIAALVLGVISLLEVGIISVLRGVAAYITLFVVAFAFFLLDDVTIDKEKLFKLYILIWFAVGLTQLLFNRSFMSGIVSGARISSYYRGCIGLASEPSFFGVQCFYFLYVAKSFKKRKYLYYILLAIMAVGMAQSLAALLFVCPFYLQELIEEKVGVKKIVMIIAAVAASVVAVYVLVNYFPSIRLSKLIIKVFNSGNSGIEDQSAQVRLSTIMNSFSKSFENYLIPIGFTKRLGSAWGGIICEMGFLAIPYIIIIPFTFSRVYSNIFAKILCYSAITIVYVNNIQLSNPMLAFVLGNVFYDFSKEKIRLENKGNLVKGQKTYLRFNR